MGLDGIELIMATEQEFCVELKEAECAQIRTVGDLVKLVATKLNCTCSGCSNVTAFYRIRDFMKDCFEGYSGELSSNTKLSHIIGNGQDTCFVSRFEEYFKLPLNTLPLSRPQKLLFWIKVCSALSAILPFLLPLGFIQKLLLGAICGVFVFISLIIFTRNMRTKLGPPVQRIKDLFPYVTVSKHGKITISEIEHRIKQVVSLQMNISIDKISLESRFREDLGVG